MKLPVDVLNDLIVELFGTAGCSRVESERIARHLVAADLAGHPSHGVVRVSMYLQLLADGLVRPNHQAEPVIDDGPLVVLDGGYGFGQTVGAQAVEVGIDRAAEHGVSVIGLRNSGHLGRIADWAELAADAGFVSIHFVNVSGKSLVAPFGGRDRRFGTDPIAIGIPQGAEPPILIDFATSVVAEGKTRVALLGGAAVPADALIGPDGRPTGDPGVLYGPPGSETALDPRAGPGALRAMGDQKGSALALACELLAGALIGSRLSGDERFGNGMLSIYLDPAHFPVDGFVAQVVDFADHVRAARPAAGIDRVSIPGDLERERARQQNVEGVELADGTWRLLTEAARSLGVAVPARYNPR